MLPSLPILPAPFPLPLQGINAAIQPPTSSEYVTLTFYIPGDLWVVNSHILDHRQHFGAFIHHFYVVPRLFCNILLGTEFQLAAGVSIDFIHHTVTLASCPVSADQPLSAVLRILPKKTDGLRWRVDTSDQDIVVPPITSIAVPVIYKPLPPDTDLKFVPCITPGSRPLLEVGGFHQAYIDHSTYRVLYTNLSTSTVTIPRYTRIGHIRVIPAHTPIFEIDAPSPQARDEFMLLTSMAAEGSSLRDLHPHVAFMPFDYAMDIASINLASEDEEEFEPSKLYPFHHKGSMPPPLPDAPTDMSDEELLDLITINQDLPEAEIRALRFVLQQHMLRFRNSGTVANEPESE